MRQKMALEEYIKQVKEVWTNYTLDLVNYQNKCRLIRYVHVSARSNDDMNVHAEDGMSSSRSVARILIP